MLVCTGCSHPEGIGSHALAQLLSSPHAPARVVSGERSPRSHGDTVAIEPVELDVSVRESVARFVDRLCRIEEHVDMLLLCAGCMRADFNDAGSTKDGRVLCDEACATHFGQLYILQSLVERGKLAPRARVVVVSSARHTSFSTLGDLERVLARPKDGPVDETSTPATRYDASKAVQLLGVCHEHIKLRASREDGPRLVFVSPGFVPTTALSRELAWPLRLASTWLLPLMPFATSIDSAASIVVHALTMTEAEASGQGELPLYIGVKRGGGTETRQIDERLVHALLTTELDQEEVRALELWCPRDSSKTARLLV